MEGRQIQFSLLALLIVVTIAAVAVRFWVASLVVAAIVVLPWIPLVPLVVALAILLPLKRRRMRRLRAVHRFKLDGSAPAGKWDRHRDATFV